MRIGEVEFVGLAFRMNSVAMVMQCCQLSLLYLVHQKAQILLGHTVSVAHIYTHFPVTNANPLKSNPMRYLCVNIAENTTAAAFSGRVTSDVAT